MSGDGSVKRACKNVVRKALNSEAFGINLVVSCSIFCLEANVLMEHQCCRPCSCTLSTKLCSRHSYGMVLQLMQFGYQTLCCQSLGAASMVALCCNAREGDIKGRAWEKSLQCSVCPDFLSVGLS